MKPLLKPFPTAGDQFTVSDSFIMPWGKYEGEKIANVPAPYLLWLYENKKCSGKVKTYIEQNMDVLKKEVTS